MKKEFNNSKKVLTGAKKATACVALTGLLVGSVGLRVASLGCAANNSIDEMCPLAKLETMLFGVEAGMQHQAQDIEKYSRVYNDRKVTTEDVTYTGDVLTYTVLTDRGEEVISEEETWSYENNEFSHSNGDVQVLRKTK